MALKKMLVVNNVECAYWKVVGFNTSLTGKLCQVFLVGYKDEESRLQGLNISNKNYIIKQNKFDTYIALDENNNVISKLYDFLKYETEDFKDAEDI